MHLHKDSMTRRQDEKLDLKIACLHKEVETWAQRNGLWHDCGFFDYTERVVPVDWDETGYITVFAGEGRISNIVISRDYLMDQAEGSKLSEEFDQILDRNGFWYENYDHTEMWIYATDPAFERHFKEYMHWKWICSLVKPEFDILDQELYAHFAGHPDQLSNLQWREFEEIVAALLESQGYKVELGLGRNDGGVDIKLLQRDPIGDILTLVQVKRYRPDRKIRLEAVQALYGAAMADSAEKSMFVTTSAYLPSVKKFAARRNVQMALHVSSDVQEWCVSACNGIVEDKRKLVDEEYVARAIEKARSEYGQILHSNVGYNMVKNRFAVVLKETRNAALLLDLSARVTEHDGYEQRGREVPNLESVPPLLQTGVDRIRRVRRVRGEAGDTSAKFWDGSHLYSPWDGNPVHFDHCD